MITLAENEKHLVEDLRTLPPSVADQVMNWVARLRELGSGGNVDWSDTWTEEDLADARTSSFSSLEDRERRKT